MLADIIVLESDGEEEICVIITNGILAINVTVLLTTDDDSATGIHYCSFMKLTIDPVTVNSCVLYMALHKKLTDAP